MRKTAIGVLALCVVWAGSAWGQLADTKIAFIQGGDVYTVLSDGSGLTQITSGGGKSEPAWSPDGTRIAYTSSVDGDSEIYVMDADGVSVVNLTSNLDADSSPTWSPDGQQIAFATNRDGTGVEIYVMNADGTVPMRLTNIAGDDTDPAWSPDGSKIAFRSTRDGDNEIYVMDANGANPTRLTTRGANDSGPSWSADSLKLAFVSDFAGSFDIWVMDANGANLLPLTTDARPEWRPRWSPDSSKIAFLMDDVATDELWVMDASGANGASLGVALGDGHDWSPFLAPSITPTVADAGVAQIGASSVALLTFTNVNSATLTVTNITSDDAQFTVAPTAFTLAPAANQIVMVTFTPTRVGWETANITVDHDGGGPKVVTASGIGGMPVVVPTGNLTDTRIAFASGRDGNNEIYVMQADGTSETNITNDPANDTTPSWSPDGSRIAFMSDRDGNYDLYVMNADGSNATRLTTDPALDALPRWSPDGARIVFKSGRSGTDDVWVMDADGTNLVNLTEASTAQDNFPAWSPDGTRIAFSSDRTGDTEVYVMDADGTNVTNLTNSVPSTDDAPMWSHDGTRIAYSRREAGVYDIYIMNADGSGVANNVTNHGFVDQSADWSPDDSSIAFTPTAEISVVDVATEAVTALTTGTATNSYPSWSPFLPSATVTPTSLSLGKVFVASEGTATFTVSNPASGDLVVTDITSDNTQFTASPKAFTVAAGGSQVVTATFLPTVVGWETGTLAVVSNAPAGPTTVAVEGIGRMEVVVPSGDLSGDTGIAFQSNRTGGEEIFVINADGTAETQLTVNAALDIDPRWSPDGTTIAFTTDRGGSQDVYAMNADGTGQIPLAADAAIDANPTWSPDGSKIAFASSRDGDMEIYVMNVDGSGVVQLTYNTVIDRWPYWSPDGSQLLFLSERAAPGVADEVYIMNADGSGVTGVTTVAAESPAAAADPAVWSPDGASILYRSSDSEIYSVGVDGTGAVNLTNTAAPEIDASWSPDGAKIVYMRNDGANASLYTMNADGSGVALLGTAGVTESSADWSSFLTPGIPTGGALITVNDAQGQVGGTATVSITSSDLTGLGVTAIDLTLSYDSNLLTPTTDGGGATNAVKLGSLIPGTWTLEQNEPSPGQIRAALAGGFGDTAPAAGAADAVLVTIDFTVSGTAVAGDTSSLLLIESKLNETAVPSNVVNGTFTAFDLMIGDVTGNGEISAYDGSWVLEYVANAMIGTTIQFPVETSKPVWADGPLTAAQAYTVGDVDPVDSVITAFDAQFILKRSVFLVDALPIPPPAAAPSIAGASYALRGAASGTRPGARITVSLDTEGVAGLHAGELLFEFDPALLTPVSARLRDAAAYEHNPLVVHKRGEGLFAVVFASAEALEARDGLLDVEFEATNNVTQTTRGDIRLSRLRLNRDLVEPDFSYGFIIQPYEFRLFANFPNPFNPETWIPFELNAAADVVVDIYSMDGRRVRRLELGSLPMGEYADRNGAAYWDGRNSLGEVSVSGLYIYQLRAGEDTAMRRMMLLK